MNVQPADAPAASPVCKECGARPAIPGVGACLRCLDGRVIAHQATLDAGRRSP